MSEPPEVVMMGRETYERLRHYLSGRLVYEAAVSRALSALFGGAFDPADGWPPALDGRPEFKQLIYILASDHEESQEFVRWLSSLPRIGR